MTFDIDTRRPYMTLFAIQKYLHVLLTYLLDYITQGPGSFLITVFFSYVSSCCFVGQKSTCHANMARRLKLYITNSLSKLRL